MCTHKLVSHCPQIGHGERGADESSDHAGGGTTGSYIVAPHPSWGADCFDAWGGGLKGVYSTSYSSIASGGEGRKAWVGGREATKPALGPGCGRNTTLHSQSHPPLGAPIEVVLQPPPSRHMRQGIHSSPGNPSSAVTHSALAHKPHTGCHGAVLTGHFPKYPNHCPALGGAAAQDA